MIVNFFDTGCQEQVSEHLFGICDDQNSSKAYTDVNDIARWIVVVENGAAIQITFTAIDHCISLYRENGDMESRCDGMLTYIDNIIFVELKEVRTSGWIPGGVEQLRHTITLFKNSHNLLEIKKRRAFLVNKKRPDFQYGHKALMAQFKNETGARLIIHGIIKI